MSTKSVILIIVVLVIVTGIILYLRHTNARLEAINQKLNPPPQLAGKTDDEKQHYFNELLNLLPDNQPEFEARFNKLAHSEKIELSERAKERNQNLTQISAILTIIKKLADHDIQLKKETEIQLAQQN